MYRLFIQGNSSSESILNGAGLLENLFQHEMLIAIFLNFTYTEVEYLYFRYELFILYCLKNKFISFYYRYVIIIQVNNTVGILHDGCGIGSNEVFTLSDPENQGATFSCGYNQIRFILA